MKNLLFLPSPISRRNIGEKYIRISVLNFFYIIVLYIFISLFIPGVSVYGQVQDVSFSWAKKQGGLGTSYGNSIVVDDFGYVYTTGYFYDTVDFDPSDNTYNLTSLGSTDIYISKSDQFGNFIWAKQIGGFGSDGGNSIVKDINGNLYITGSFSSGVDFDPSPDSFYLYSAGFSDIFIIKLDQFGNLIWAKQTGGTGTDIGNSIKVDNNGNIYLSGIFEQTSDFNPGSGVYSLTSIGMEDIFICKLNHFGNFVWAKQFGGTGSDKSNSIEIDNSLNIYVTGSFVGTSDFNPNEGISNLTSFGGSDIFILKVNNFGSLVWAKQLGGTGNESGSSLVVDDLGNVYSTGYFNGSSDFNPGSESYNLNSFLEDIYISKLSSAGNFIWAKQFGGSSIAGDRGNSIVIDDIGNIYLTGQSGDCCTYYYSIIILKVDNNGNTKWVKQLGSLSGLNFGNSIALDPSENIFATGVFSGAVDFDPSEASNILISDGATDIFILKLVQTNTCIPITISNNVQSQTASVCNSKTFTVTTNGSLPIQYAWYKNNILIPNSNAPSYTTPPLTISDNGNSYYCIVSNCNDINRDTSNNAILTVNAPCIFNNPGISLSSSTLIPGQSLNINGVNFTYFGEIELTVRNENGELVGQNVSINYINPGKFSFTLPITNTFLDGLYSVNAIDLSTGYNAPLKTFRVNNLITHTLKIKSPSAGSSYVLGNLFDIIWSDVALSNTPVSQTGFVNKTFHVEISNNNGVSWTNVGVGNYTFKANVAKIKPFSIRYSLINAGTFIIKVSDIDNPANFNISQPFIINHCNSAGFKSSLHWDVTIPQDIKVNTDPIGLAADGTARIFVKLKKNTTNLKSVSSIMASILPFGSIESGPGLLGKIMYATNHKTYSEEANNASLTSILHNAVQYGNSNSNEYWFWLVAPDDFTTELDFEGSKREIIVEFTISYTDNSTEEIITCKPIGIFRPALMFVHGIAGHEESFKNARYLNNAGTQSSFDFSGEWEAVKRINLKEFDSFENNAKLILGVDADENYKFENSFQSLLRGMHIDGIANKRVDYIAHSMGGVVGRTAVNYGNQWYSPGIGMYKNYSKGYINKFITLNTPHNGSYLADFSIIYLYPLLTGILAPYSYFKKQWYVVNNNISPAATNLMSGSNGVKFGQTNVRNHLISADIDPLGSFSEEYIIRNIADSYILDKTYKAFKFIYPDLLLHEFINLKFYNSEFLSETDGVVQISSQLAGKNKADAINIISTPFEEGTTSIISGVDKFHIGIQRDIAVGTRIKTLLNAGINSGFFADDIPANPNFQNFTSNDDNIAARIVTLEDSVFYRYDTLFCKIISPISDTIVMVDSTIQIKVKLKDTIGFQNLSLYFQSGVYYSETTDSIQSFQINVNQENLGKNFIVAIAQYDSLGYSVNHIDSLSLKVSTLEQKTGFYVTPESRHLNPNQSFNPEYFLVYPTFIGQLFAGVDTLIYEIKDTNVVFFDSINFEFVTKDTGTTHIVFEYNGFMDTIFIYVSELIDKNVYSLCPHGTIALYAGSNDPNKVYQWQLDTLDSFINMSDNSIYTGTTSSTLLITNAPTNLYDHTYRCLISDVVGSAVSDSYTLKFGSVWTGTVDTTWENPLNWNCESIPSSHTDVLIPADVPRFPHVNSFAYSRSIKLAKNAKLDVSSGYILCVGNSNTGLTCPSDTIIYVALGISEVSVDYQLQTIGNCSGSILQTLGIPSGGLFPLGSTTNCFELRDEQNVILGNCCFDVLVISSISIVLAIPGPTVTEISLTQHPLNVDLWSGQVFIAAGVKFRANNSWDLHWGGEIFPSGTASLNGNYIGIPEAGTYIVTFNTRTLAYNFTLLCPSNISFTSQNQIDNFATDYPTCQEILGDLTISGNDIWNLSGLSQITSIEGTLGIYNNPNLSDFTGLSGLTNVGNGLNITGNSSLTNLNGLNTLNSVLGYVSINNNASLSSLFGLNGLNTVGQYLSIGGPGGNPLLASLNGLQSLTTIGGNFQIHGNSALTSLVGLNSLTSIGGSLNIGNNTALSTCSIQAICDHLSIPFNISNISGNAIGCNSINEVQLTCGLPISCTSNITFTSQAEIDAFPTIHPSCNSITGNVTIQGSDITNLSGLSQIISIDGNLTIGGLGGNPNLASLEGLNSLITVGGTLHIFNNIGLINIGALNSLTTLNGDLNIINNTSLSNCETQGVCDYLSGFPINANVYGNAPGCNSVAQVQIACNIPVSCPNNITIAIQNDLDSFADTYVGCTSITGNVIIHGGDITNLNGLSQITSIGGSLTIENNTLLTSLTGLNSLVTIGSSLYLSANNVLTDLGALNGLISTGSHLSISQNSALSNLNGLSSVISIGGQLLLYNNISLTSLSGLNALNFIGNNLFLQDNTSLSICDISAICSFLSIPINTANISGNATGCSSRAEVEAECGN